MAGKKKVSAPIIVRSTVKLGTKLMMELRVHDLVAGSTYQTIRNESRVKQIADNYDPNLFGYPLISARDNGVNAIVDGQHRIGAYIRLLTLGLVQDEYIWCEVRQGLTEAQEATIYTHLAKRRRKVQPMQEFRADMVAGDSRATLINATVNKCRLNIPWQRESIPNPRSILCVGTLSKIYNRLGSDKFPLMFRLMVAAYRDPSDGSIDKSALQHEFCEGLATFYGSDSNVYKDSQITATLKDHAPGNIVARAYANQMKKEGRRNGRRIAYEIKLILTRIMAGASPDEPEDDAPIQFKTSRTRSTLNN